MGLYRGCCLAALLAMVSNVSGLLDDVRGGRVLLSSTGSSESAAANDKSSSYLNMNGGGGLGGLGGGSLEMSHDTESSAAAQADRYSHLASIEGGYQRPLLLPTVPHVVPEQTYFEDSPAQVPRPSGSCQIVRQCII